MPASTTQPLVVIPNYNGGDELLEAVNSLKAQSLQPRIVIVDNASSDDSIAKITANHPEIDLILHELNKGYAGGVNPGFRLAIESGAEYVAPFNDDAVADKDWLKNLVTALEKNPTAGVVTCKVTTGDGKNLDSTGDIYTNWGLPYPRGRHETNDGKFDEPEEVFAASGAASLYQVSVLKEVGLLDEDFFAYYEDVDLSFRMQLAGWKVIYEPKAEVRHKIGMTSSRMRGFTTYQTMKNLPLLAYKNVPRKYLNRVMWRLTLARFFFLCRATTRGQLWPALKGDIMATYLLAKKVKERRRIQQTKKVSDEYIWNIMDHDLPPNAHALRKLRQLYWKLTLRKRA